MANPLAAPARPAAPKAPAGPVIPFMRGTVLHTEPFYDSGTVALSVNTQTIGPIDIPTFGFLRALWLKVDLVGSNTDAAVAVQEDAPWSIFSQLQVNDVNGAPIFGPHAGYEIYCHHKYGGFRAQRDPKLMPSTVYTAITTGTALTAGSGKFAIRINLERSARDGLGALANMNASAAYKLSATIGNLAAIYSTAPNNAGATYRLRVSAECYSQPNPFNQYNQQQAVVPPANMTTGYSSRFVWPVVAGQNIIKHTRVGNLIRNNIYIARRAGTSRANGEADLLNQQLQWYVDSRMKTNQLYADLQMEQAEMFGFVSPTLEAAGGPDNGVFVMAYMQEFDGFAGYELRDLLLPTTSATRYELTLPNMANSGTLVVMTDDISPNGNIWVS